MLLIVLIPPRASAGQGLLAPPHADLGVDTDGDGLFDVLRVDVHVNTVVPGQVYLIASLRDGTNTTAIQNLPGFIGATIGGPSTITVNFTGGVVRSGGFEGPYIVNLMLLDDSYSLTDWGSHTTQAYTRTQFDPVPEEFLPPFASAGEDRDTPPDGLFNVLRVDVRVNVTTPGAYGVGGGLWDQDQMARIDYQEVYLDLAPGPRTVPLFFSGLVIRNRGFSGRYVLLVYLDSLEGGVATLVAQGSDRLSPYLASQFQGATATVQGTVRDDVTSAPIVMAEVFALNYRDATRVVTYTGGTGTYTFGLYPGDWVFTYDGSSYQSNGTGLAVTGPVTLPDARLSAVRSSPVDLRVTFRSWTEAESRVHATGVEDNATYRRQVEWEFGDRDQVLTTDEFNVSFAVPGRMAIPLWAMLSGPPLEESSQGEFTVDGRPFEKVLGSDGVRYTDLAARVDDPLPPQVERNTSRRNATVPPASTHTIALNVTYENPMDVGYTTFAYFVQIPPPFTLASYSPTPAVTVTDLGGGLIEVDPGVRPGTASAWVTLTAAFTDVTPPTIASPRAVPDPAEVAQTTALEADVTDDSGVASVYAEVADPLGAAVGNFTMALATGDTYQCPFAPAKVGTYTLNVTAWDIAGNPAVASGTFAVRDTVRPAIADAAAVPNPAELGQAVSVQANVTDAGGVASVHIEIRDPGGAAIGNFTMAHGTGNAYGYGFTPAAIGTYRFTVTALDASGNPGVVSGTFVVRDTTRPTANAGPDQTVPQHTVVTFDGSASTDNDRIENYTWTFTDSGTRTLYGVGPTYRFERAGAFTVTVTVRDPSGNLATDEVLVTVTPAIGAVRGTVRDPVGSPLAGAIVRLLNGSTEVASTTTNATGGYAFPDVAPGTYTVRAELPGYDPKAESATVVAGETTTRDIVLSATATPSPLPAWVLPAVIAAVIVVALLVGIAYGLRRRSKAKKAEEESTDQAEKKP